MREPVHTRVCSCVCLCTVAWPVALYDQCVAACRVPVAIVGGTFSPLPLYPIDETYQRLIDGQTSTIRSVPAFGPYTPWTKYGWGSRTGTGSWSPYITLALDAAYRQAARMQPGHCSPVLLQPPSPHYCPAFFNSAAHTARTAAYVPHAHITLLVESMTHTHSLTWWLPGAVSARKACSRVVWLLVLIMHIPDLRMPTAVTLVALVCGR